MAITTYGVEDKIELKGPSVIGRLSPGLGEAEEIPLSKFLTSQVNPLTGAIEIIDPQTGLPIAVGGGGSAETQTQVTASQNLDSTATGKKLVSTSATAITLTILNDTIGGFTENAKFSIMQLGAGAITVAAGSGVTIRIRAGFPAQVQYDTVYLTRVGANEWVME